MKKKLFITLCTLCLLACGMVGIVTSKNSRQIAYAATSNIVNEETRGHELHPSI